MVIFFSFLQPAKAFLPMVVTLAPITTLVSFFFAFLKAFLSMAVTFAFTPFTVTVAGILIVFFLAADYRVTVLAEVAL